MNKISSHIIGILVAFLYFSCPIDLMPGILLDDFIVVGLEVFNILISFIKTVRNSRITK